MTATYECMNCGATVPTDHAGWTLCTDELGATCRPTPMRPIMTRDELAGHKVDEHGRDYSKSDDGYSDMEVASGEGWHAVSGWGRDGWDLGDWPYVVVSVRNRPAKVETWTGGRPGGRGTGDETLSVPLAKLQATLDELLADRIKWEIVDHGGYEMRQTVEGDTTVYRFATLEDRAAGIDYLFVWYGLGREYDEWIVEGLTHDKRDGLDAGALRVPERFRGPFSWERLDAVKAAQ